MGEDRIAKLKEFLAKNPDDSFTRYALGLEYAALGDVERSVELFQQVLRHDPAYIPAYHQLGYAFQKLGRKQDAVDAFQRGIQTAEEQGDLHARSEMQDALDELET